MGHYVGAFVDAHLPDGEDMCRSVTRIRLRSMADVEAADLASMSRKAAKVQRGGRVCVLRVSRTFRASYIAFEACFQLFWRAFTACFCLYGEARIESGLLLCFIVRFPEVILCDRAVRLLQGLSAW
jgi:hypothetical protein